MLDDFPRWIRVARFDLVMRLLEAKENGFTAPVAAPTERLLSCGYSGRWRAPIRLRSSWTSGSSRSPK
jgi:hypothetical protein